MDDMFTFRFENKPGACARPTLGYTIKLHSIGATTLAGIHHDDTILSLGLRLNLLVVDAQDAMRWDIIVSTSV